MIAEQHEHGHKNGSEDGPLGRAGGDEKVDDHRQQNEGNAHRRAREADALEEIGAADGKHGAQLGPVEQHVELSGEETEHDVAAHGRRLLDHAFVEVAAVLDRAGGITVHDARQREEEEQKRDHALEQRRSHEDARAVGGDLRQRAEEEAGDQQRNVSQRHPSGAAQAFFLMVAELFDLGVFGAALVLAEAGLDEPGADAADDKRAEERGGDQEEPVAGHVDRERAVGDKAFDGLIGQPLKQGVGAGDHQVGGEPGLGAGVAVDHADDGMLAHAHVNDGGHRRDHDHGGVGSDVADGAEERDHEGHQSGRNVSHALAEHGQKQAGLLAHADGERHRDDEPQRREAGEVLDHVVEKPLKSGGGEQVLGFHDRLGGIRNGRIDHREIRHGEDGADHGDDQVAIVPMIAVKRKSQQNRMAGGGSLLHTRSMPSKKRSTHDFFAAAVSVMFL